MKDKKDPLTILIDTREQRPLDFSPFYKSHNIATERTTLRFGDYSIAGYEQCFAAERKSLDDLVNTLIWDYEGNRAKPDKRFNRELDYLAQHYDRAFLLIEGGWLAIADHRYNSRAEPKAVCGLLIQVYMRYGIPFIFVDTHAFAAEILMRMAVSYVHERKQKITLKDVNKAQKVMRPITDLDLPF